MLGFHMICTETPAEAANIARAPLNRYLRRFVEAAADWTGGVSSADYPNYDKLIEGLSRETFETQTAKGAAWIGTPETITTQIRDYHEMVGGFEIASLQVNFDVISLADAERSIRLFSDEVMPAFA